MIYSVRHKCNICSTCASLGWVETEPGETEYIGPILYNEFPVLPPGVSLNEMLTQRFIGQPYFGVANLTFQINSNTVEGEPGPEPGISWHWEDLTITPSIADLDPSYQKISEGLLYSIPTACDPFTGAITASTPGPELFNIIGRITMPVPIIDGLPIIASGIVPSNGFVVPAVTGPENASYTVAAAVPYATMEARPNPSTGAYELYPTTANYSLDGSIGFLVTDGGSALSFPAVFKRVRIPKYF